jgi:hypothetical protein
LYGGYSDCAMGWTTRSYISGRGKRFLLPQKPRSTLEPTEPPIPWVRQWGCEAETRSHLMPSLCLHGMQRNNFTIRYLYLINTWRFMTSQLLNTHLNLKDTRLQYPVYFSLFFSPLISQIIGMKFQTSV